MGTDDQQRMYNEASRLFKDGKYAEALQFFEQVARERPNSKHVIYSRAMCLAMLGHAAEAQELGKLLEGFRGATAQRLRLKLEKEIEEQRLGSKTTGQPGSGQRQGLKNLRDPERRRSPERRSGDERRAGEDRRQGERPHHGPDRRQPQDRRQVPRRLDDDDLLAPLPAHLDLTHENAPRRIPGLWKLAAAAAVVLACGLAAAILAVNHTRNEEAAADRLLEQQLAAMDGPDKYMSLTEFFPSDSNRSNEFIMFLAPADANAPNEPPEINNCVGAAVASDWETILTHTGKAFAMCRSRTGNLDGIPQDNMVRTLVLPQGNMLVPPRLRDESLETFNLARGATVAAIVASCGQPDHTESWRGRAQLAGINGDTQWWGRVGVATDENGVVTHLLVRSYPRAAN